ncbi:MAG: hypothetical protein JWP02_1291 [Acidimicrobiales bacterium]|nr:hypothetical protein [Acidimicrobiales bacterium]
MPITDNIKTVEEQVLGALAIAQEAVVDGIKTVAEAVEPVIPDVPRPFATEVAGLVDGAFTFAEKLLHNSHEFAGRLLDAADTTSDTATTASAPAASTSAKPAPAAKAGAK